MIKITQNFKHMEQNSLIKINNLIKSFPVGKGKFTALNGINLTFNTGEFTGIVGPSGSGKTTLLNIIGSLDSPSAGSAIVIGQDITKLNTKRAAVLRRQHMGFIFQTYNLLPVYTVYENIEFPLLLLNMSSSERKKAVMLLMLPEKTDWIGLRGNYFDHNLPPVYLYIETKKIFCMANK